VSFKVESDLGALFRRHFADRFAHCVRQAPIYAHRPPARAAAAFADRNFGINAQRSDMQATAAPIGWIFQATHAFGQPTDATVGGMDEVSHCFRIDRGQSARDAMG
jgi:hypothetical protein